MKINTFTFKTASRTPKVLMVVAHPDDEYTFAATSYRIVQEMGGRVDQVVITDGAGGHRYSHAAESIYGLRLTDPAIAQQHLPAIRKQETLRAGQILGINTHYFLDQPDPGFTLDATEVLNGVWDRAEIVARLHLLLLAGDYDSVLTMLPSLDTHGHHQAATALTLEAVGALPGPLRPVVLTGETASSREPVRRFTEHPDFPETRVEHELPSFAFHRSGYQDVINSAVAEHKTQGLFQAVAGDHDVERFWTFSAAARASALAA